MRIDPALKTLVVLVIIFVVSLVVKQHTEEHKYRYSFPDNAFNLNDELPALGVIHSVVNELPELVTPLELSQRLSEAGLSFVRELHDDPSNTVHPATRWLTEQKSHDVKNGLCDLKITCLAIALWWENRSSRAAMCDVAWVILNRRQSQDFPSSVREVVTQTEPVLQFAFVEDGESDKPDMEDELERAAWEDAWEVAHSALSRKGECARSTIAHATFFQPYTGAKDSWWKGLLIIAAKRGHLYFVSLS